MRQGVWTKVQPRVASLTALTVLSRNTPDAKGEFIDDEDDTIGLGDIEIDAVSFTPMNVGDMIPVVLDGIEFDGGFGRSLLSGAGGVTVGTDNEESSYVAVLRFGGITDALLSGKNLRRYDDATLWIKSRPTGFKSTLQALFTFDHEGTRYFVSSLSPIDGGVGEYEGTAYVLPDFA